MGGSVPKKQGRSTLNYHLTKVASNPPFNSKTWTQIFCQRPRWWRLIAYVFWERTCKPETNIEAEKCMGFFQVWAVTCKECTRCTIKKTSSKTTQLDSQLAGASRNKRITHQNCRWFERLLQKMTSKWANQLGGNWSQASDWLSSKNPDYGMEITASDVFWKYVAIQKICHSWGEKGELPWDFPNDTDRHNFKRMVVYPMFILATMRSCEFQLLKISFQQIMISCQTPNTPPKKNVKNFPTWWIRLVFSFRAFQGRGYCWVIAIQRGVPWMTWWEGNAEDDWPISMMVEASMFFVAKVVITLGSQHIPPGPNGGIQFGGRFASFPWRVITELFWIVQIQATLWRVRVFFR